ncbi:UpxY family transcription antiterminator [Flagellimonas meridianipacifica]|uniref:Transcription antitermination factor NusG n=1 Tax=Flagellimonas meridianipacifica TaxID=1080225 RepID=A0A2T0MFN0_9FLAO|nr:UpxY family transcription antiterminator [Allomuricauda pacifica]PRX56379.1 transcription antitermination factor NusG [Allomuricauda pacifica]
MPQNIIDGWMVLYVKHHHEKKIADKLSKQGITHYLPLIKRNYTSKSVKEDYKTKPLFPTYIFVKPTSRKEIYITLKLNGAFKFLKYCAEYSKVSDQEISSIRKITNSGFIRDIQIKYIKPKVGQEVLITKGPFHGLRAEVMKNKNLCEVYLQIKCLNRYVSVIAPLNSLSIQSVKI